ncbi:aspartate aminotransferase family protein [Acidocella facilis]|uniref:aspartate aminotransferase family protein n=1 Tax=Acidocella facilis TaxID=525 RepID=UPI001F277819|nr:aminotransferase class III-fold pyridoxal phosphate-dependent enzyme [Acidocella facilis]
MARVKALARPRLAPTDDMEAQAGRLQARLRRFGSPAALHYDKPVEIVRGDGALLFDVAGQPYLDFHAKGVLVGHGNPDVASAVAAQTARLNVQTRYLHDLVDGYAERLLTLFPAPLDNVVMTNSGSEAMDLALRTARLVTGRQGVIVTSGASHGRTSAAAEISPLFAPRGLPTYVRTIPAPNLAMAGNQKLAAWFAAQVREAAQSLAASGAGVAALVVDSVFASDGVFTDPPGFLAEAAEAVRAAGGLFIADEGRAGFGRVGGVMWGFARHEMVPDIVVLGRALGNGYPSGAMLTRPDYLTRAAEEAPFFASFGANPVAAAAGQAVLETIAEEGLLRHAARAGEHLRRGLNSLAKSFMRVDMVRGAGLILGVDIANPENGEPDPAGARQIVNMMRQNFVLLGIGGVHGQTLKLCPPLCISLGQLDLFLENFRAVLAAMG